MQLLLNNLGDNLARGLGHLLHQLPRRRRAAHREGRNVVVPLPLQPHLVSFELHPKNKNF
jgi:hypothetical protein